MKKNKNVLRIICIALLACYSPLLSQVIEKKEINKDVAKIKSGELYGNYSELNKFMQLEDVCRRLGEVKEVKDKKLVLETLLLELMELKVIEEKPKNWNDLVVDLGGGSFGLLIHTYIKVSENKGFSNVYSAILNTKDPVKMKIFLKVVSSRTKVKYEAFLNEEKEKVKSEKMREVIDQHLAKIAKEREKFENSMQGRIQREREREENEKNKKQ